MTRMEKGPANFQGEFTFLGSRRPAVTVGGTRREFGVFCRLSPGLSLVLCPRLTRDRRHPGRRHQGRMLTRY